MNFKEQWIKLKKRICKEPETMFLLKRIDLAKKEMNSNEDCFLHEKIEKFLNWYALVMTEVKNSSVSIKYDVEHITNFIDKMAIWYELRYPDSEIEKLFSEGAGLSECNWGDTFDRDTFFQLLSDEEKDYLRIPVFPSSVTLNADHNITIHLTKTGKVKDVFLKELNKEEDTVLTDLFKGIPLQDVTKALHKFGFIYCDRDEKIEDVLLQYNSQFDIREGVLNCVMYKIIKRGGEVVGAKRAFLFAKEFSLNIDIPMSYGYSCFDVNFRGLVNEYLKAGGSKDLLCYVSYFSNYSLTDKMSLKQLLGSSISNITEEEKDLYQRLVNALANQNVSDSSKPGKVKMKKRT